MALDRTKQPQLKCELLPVSNRYGAGSPARDLFCGAEPGDHLQHIAVREHGGGVALQDVEVAARESVTLLRGRKQRAGLSDEAFGILFGCGYLFLGQRFIDHYDKGGEFAEPLEGWIFQHEVEKLSAAGDGRYITFVHGALQVEQRFVQLQQSIAKVLEAGAEVGHATIVT